MNNYCAATCGYCTAASQVETTASEGFGIAEGRAGMLPPCKPCADRVPLGKLTCPEYRNMSRYAKGVGTPRYTRLKNTHHVTSICDVVRHK